MDVIMEDDYDKFFVFEESLEIDFEYEFDALKFFDFTKFETPEEIAESELWFDLAGGYSPSPFIVEMDMVTDDLTNSVASSPRYGSEFNALSADNVTENSEVSSTFQARKGPQMLRSISMPTSQPNVPLRSRLLQPTASLLAKKNQNIGVHSRRVPGRLLKPGNPINSPAEADATKRQKLEIGYLRKVAQLKHQTSFSHKSIKKVGNTDVSSQAKTKVTVPKEPELATAHRALRQRSNHPPHLGSDSSSFRARPLNGKIQEAKISIQAKNRITTPLPQFQDNNAFSGKVVNGSGMLELNRTNYKKSSLQQKADQVYSSKARPLNRRIFPSKGDIGVSGNCKKETTVPKEFKLSSSKKLLQNPPTDLFSKLSLIPENPPTLLLEKHPPHVKDLKKNESFPSMKENKNKNAATEKSNRCFGNGARMISCVGNHLNRVRTFTIR